MLPAQEQKQEYVEQMFDDIAPRYDVMNRLMTFGIDRSWRKKTIREAGVGPGSTVVDIGCGSGDLCVDSVEAGAEVIGVDPSAGMLEICARRAPSATLLRTVGESMPIDSASCDAVVSGFALRNWHDIPAVFTEAARVLKPGGRLAVLEIDVPTFAPIRWGFNFYFGKVVPLLGAVFSTGSAYKYLAESLVYLPSQDEMKSMLETAGYTNIKKHRFTFGVAQLVTAEKANHHSEAGN